MTFLARIFYALLAVFFTFTAMAGFLAPGYPLHQAIGHVGLASLGYVWLWDSFNPIARRFTLTLAAVVFAYLAVIPPYDLATALFSAVATLNIVAAVVAWYEHVTEQKAADRLARELREHPPTDPRDAEWAADWLADYDSKHSK